MRDRSTKTLPPERYGERLRDYLNDYAKHRVTHRLTIYDFADHLLITIAALKVSTGIWPVDVYDAAIPVETPVNHADNAEYRIWHDADIVKLKRSINGLSEKSAWDDSQNVICFVLDSLLGDFANRLASETVPLDDDMAQATSKRFWDMSEEI